LRASNIFDVGEKGRDGRRGRVDWFELVEFGESWVRKGEGR
jgi:hypothetical protein